MTQFPEMSGNYLTPHNHKAKAYHLHTGRQLTGNAKSLRETWIFDLIFCCYATASTLIYQTVPSTNRVVVGRLSPMPIAFAILAYFGLEVMEVELWFRSVTCNAVVGNSVSASRSRFFKGKGAISW
jgi:hypothetical protein